MNLNVTIKITHTLTEEEAKAVSYAHAGARATKGTALPKKEIEKIFLDKIKDEVVDCVELWRTTNQGISL